MISFKEFLLEDQNDNNNNKVLSIIKNNPTKTKIINTYYERLKNIFTFKDNDKTIIYYNNILWCLQYLEQNLNSLKIFSDFLEELNHYQLYIPKVEFKNQKPEDIIAKLKKFYDEAKAKEEKNKGITPQKNDEILIKCKSGNSWWFVDRAYCPEEGRSGNHCGNVVGQQKPDQRILSLRNSANQVILTFILEPDNTLGEMKAKGNLKPSSNYHSDIIELLKHKPFILTKNSKKESFQISGISGQGYLPHMNFSIFDLSEKDLLDIHEHNPKFITDQIKINPTELLKSSEYIKNEYKNSVPPLLKKLIEEPSLENWMYIISNKKYEDLIIYVPQKYWNDFPNYKEKLINILAKSNDLLLKAPPEISKDFEILKEVISLTPQHIRFIQNTYKYYDDLLILAITKKTDVLDSIPGEYISKNVAIFILNNYPDKIGFVKNEYIPEGYKIDLKGKKNLIVDGPLLSSLKNICPEKVPGTFSCASITNLTSLEGSPTKVGKDFTCYYTKIKSLKYGPKEVGGDYICYINKLTSLEGAPEIINNSLHCNDNQLTSLKYSPKKIGGNFYCSFNQLISLEGAPEIINDSLHCNDNQLTSLKYSPKKIGGNFNCSSNKLISLEGAPEKIGGNFNCSSNKLTSLKYGPKEVGGYSCTNNLLETLAGCSEIINGDFNCSNNKLTSLELGPKVVKGYYNCKNNSKQFTVEDVRKVCQVNGNIIV